MKNKVENSPWYYFSFGTVVIYVAKFKFKMLQHSSSETVLGFLSALLLHCYKHLLQRWDQLFRTLNSEYQGNKFYHCLVPCVHISLLSLLSSYKCTWVVNITTLYMEDLRLIPAPEANHPDYQKFLRVSSTTSWK
jgi:hypothetical protein